MYTCKEVIGWFKAKGCYVIGGVPTHWRDQNSDSRHSFIEAYKAFDMLSPWMVGRFGKIMESDDFYANVNVADISFCKAYKIDYQPCVMPGDLQAKQRVHGDFMWRQFYNMCRVGAQGIYVSMTPQGSSFVTLDEDGTAVRPTLVK